MTTSLAELLDNKFNNGDVIAAVLEALRASDRALTAAELVEAVKPLGVHTIEVFICVALDDLLGVQAVRRAAGRSEAFEAVEPGPDDPQPAAPAVAPPHPVEAAEQPQGGAAGLLKFRTRKEGGARRPRPPRRVADAREAAATETAAR